MPLGGGGGGGIVKKRAPIQLIRDVGRRNERWRFPKEEEADWKPTEFEKPRIRPRSNLTAHIPASLDGRPSRHNDQFRSDNTDHPNGESQTIRHSKIGFPDVPVEVWGELGAGFVKTMGSS